MARGNSIVDDISRFCRSKSVEDSCGFSFVKSWTDLHRFDREGRGSLLDLWPFGLLWQWPPWQDGARIQTCEVGSVSHHLLSLWLNILFHFKIWCTLSWLWVHLSLHWLWAPIVLTFLKCEHSFFFFFFSLAGWWNHLMVCWLSFIFLVFYLRNFLYKGMLLPSSLRHMLNLQLSSLAFKIFLLLISLYLFASFLVIFFFLMCYETFSLTKFCCCLFLFCNIVSLIFGFWHQTLHWCSWCIDAIPGTCLWSYTGFCLGN